MTTAIEPFDIYIPRLGTWLDRQLPLGTGIVGRAEGDRVLIHYEKPGVATNIRTWADRLYHAADRMETEYPTSKKAWPERDDLMFVGQFWLDGRQSRIEIGDSEKVSAWLGKDALEYPDSAEPELQFSW